MHGALPTPPEALAKLVPAQRRGNGGDLELGIAGEQPLVQALQRRPRIDAKVVSGPVREGSVGLQRLDRSARPVEGQHQPADGTLAVEIPRQHVAKAVHRARGVAAGHERVCQAFMRRPTGLVQSTRLWCHPGLVSQVGVGVTAPQRQRLAPGADRLAVVPAVAVVPGRGDEAGESDGVDVHRAARQAVAPTVAHDALFASRGEGASKARHIAAQRVVRPGRGAVAEDGLDEAVDGDRRSVGEHQSNQEPPLPRTAEVARTVTVDRPHRSKNLDLDARSLRPQQVLPSMLHFRCTVNAALTSARAVGMAAAPALRRPGATGLRRVPANVAPSEAPRASRMRGGTMSRLSSVRSRVSVIAAAVLVTAAATVVPASGLPSLEMRDPHRPHNADAAERWWLSCTATMPRSAEAASRLAESCW